MRKLWRHWRPYFDGLEELMRLSGERLEQDAAGLVEDLGLNDLPADVRRREVLRRALKMPFFGELVDEALRSREEDVRTPADREFLPSWSDGQVEASASSVAGAPPVGGDVAPRGRRSGGAPMRLRTAERVLASRTRSLTVILDNLTNPLNASAVVRSCEALGLQEIHFCHRDGLVALSGGIHRECHRWVDMHWYRSAETAVRTLRRRGFTVLAADLVNGSLPVEEIGIDPPLALVFGNEQVGVSDEFRRLADGFFHIPTCGFTTFVNVSNAVAMSVSAIDRRLRESGSRQPLPRDEQAGLRKAWYASLARTADRRREFLSYADNPPEPLEEGRSRPRRHGDR